MPSLVNLRTLNRISPCINSHTAPNSRSYTTQPLNWSYASKSSWATSNARLYTSKTEDLIITRLSSTSNISTLCFPNLPHNSKFSLLYLLDSQSYPSLTLVHSKTLNLMALRILILLHSLPLNRALHHILMCVCVCGGGGGGSGDAWGGWGYSERCLVIRESFQKHFEIGD